MSMKYNHLFKVRYYDKNNNLIGTEYLILESDSELVDVAEKQANEIALQRAKKLCDARNYYRREIITEVIPLPSITS